MINIICLALSSTLNRVPDGLEGRLNQKVKKVNSFRADRGRKLRDFRKNHLQKQPKLENLTKSVYQGRVMLSSISGDMLPSFHVQFPFFMTSLIQLL